ncbi:polysaccharide biosynthesis C-terminal domain-containing protein [Halobacillus yeomjeoni]|uniref:murein biosynthesis integral membrane protein MurJ n=1 Tax=Halobacillus yeomjeoni TaxID=311194 RepID=UPI001CD2B0C5|nr:lipid II flippase MurJ [Halobacillus yeomjeoni]MCA0985213.1 polysaccharide biosynthesis C-terminal domain-containing protein [Halobacillus yeomjeoni]
MSKLKKAAIWTTLLALVLKVIGFVREVFIAKEFGATDYTDGFILAFTFVTLMKTLIKNGFNSVFLPQYKKNQRKDPEEAERNANSMLNYTVVLFVVLGGLAYVFTPYIILIYGSMAETTEMVAIRITRFFFLFTVIIGLTSVLESYLQAVRSFVPNQIVNLLGTGMATVFIVLFSDLWGIYSIAYGFITGLAIGLALQVYYLYKYGYRWTLTFNINKTFAKTFIVLFVPSILHASVGHINVFIDKTFASSTVSGAVTYLNNASLLMSIPSAIFQSTVVAIIFTLLSEQNEQKDKFKDTLHMGYQIGLLTLMPIAAGLLLLADQAISFIFERGAYSAVDAQNTVTVLYYYIPLVVTQGLLLIPIKAMYALGETKQLLKISSTTIIANVILNFLFVEWIGYPGLALSSTVVSFYYITFVSISIYKEMPAGEMPRLLKLIVQVTIPTAIMAVPILLIEFFTPIHELYSLFQMMILIPVGAVAYVIGLYLFYREGFNRVVEFVRRKAKKA